MPQAVSCAVQGFLPPSSTLFGTSGLSRFGCAGQRQTPEPQRSSYATCHTLWYNPCQNHKVSGQSEVRDKEAHVANASIGSVIRNLREQRGLSQVELAEKARVGQSYLSRLESGSRGARADEFAATLYRIATVLEVSTDELFLEAGIRPSQDREGDLRWREMERIFRTMPADRQNELLAIARTLATLAPETRPRVSGGSEGQEEAAA